MPHLIYMCEKNVQTNVGRNMLLSHHANIHTARRAELGILD